MPEVELYNRLLVCQQSPPSHKANFQYDSPPAKRSRGRPPKSQPAKLPSLLTWLQTSPKHASVPTESIPAAVPLQNAQQSVQVKLELGHTACLRERPTSEGFTHDWTVFVRGPEGSNILHFVEKVVFHLHESFPKPKRVLKDPPYQVSESGYGSFLLPIEIYFKNKEDPRKIKFDYDLFLHLVGTPPINHIRCEKLTFQNPTEEFRRKLLKGGGVGIPGPGDISSTPSSSSTTVPAQQPPPAAHNKVFENLFGAPIKADPGKKSKSHSKEKQSKQLSRSDSKSHKSHRDSESASKTPRYEDRPRKSNHDDDISRKVPRLDDHSSKPSKHDDKSNRPRHSADPARQTPKHEDRAQKTPRMDERSIKSLDDDKNYKSREGEKPNKMREDEKKFIKTEESSRKATEERLSKKESSSVSSKRPAPESRPSERSHSSKKHKRDRSHDSSHSSMKSHPDSHSKHASGERRHSESNSKGHSHKSKHRDKDKHSQEKSSYKSSSSQIQLTSDKSKQSPELSKQVVSTSISHRRMQHIASKPSMMEKAMSNTPPPPALIPPAPPVQSSPSAGGPQPHSHLVPFEENLSTGELSDSDPFDDDPPELANESHALSNSLITDFTDKMSPSDSDSSSDEDEGNVTSKELFLSSKVDSLSQVVKQTDNTMARLSPIRSPLHASSPDVGEAICRSTSPPSKQQTQQVASRNGHRPELKTKAAQKAPVWQYSRQPSSPSHENVHSKENKADIPQCLPSNKTDPGTVELNLKAPNGETFLSLLELQERLMGLNDNLMLAKVVRIIQETGHYQVSDASFDFDLCSIDSDTVKKIKTFLASNSSVAACAKS